MDSTGNSFTSSLHTDSLGSFPLLPALHIHKASLFVVAASEGCRVHFPETPGDATSHSLLLASHKVQPTSLSMFTHPSSATTVLSNALAVGPGLILMPVSPLTSLWCEASSASNTALGRPLLTSCFLTQPFSPLQFGSP